MPDLDKEIAGWRDAMTRGGIDDPAVLDELESHLRDFIAEEVRLGRDVGSALQAGLERIGPASALRREFSRANPAPILAGVSALLRDRRKCFWMALALSVLVSVGFYCWHARATPVYESAVTLQLRWVGQQLFQVSPDIEPDIRATEDLNAFLKLLSSQTLRTRVADSLTPTEQEIVRRTTAGHPAVDEPVSVRDLLGSLTLRPMRNSLIVTLSVLHEDPEAAALIANRYAEQCHLYFEKLRRGEAAALVKRNASVLEKLRGGSSTLMFRVVDAATPARWPASPNRTKILAASTALAVGLFAGLLIIAAALRKFASGGIDSGPQEKTT